LPGALDALVWSSLDGCGFGISRSLGSIPPDIRHPCLFLWHSELCVERGPFWGILEDRFGIFDVVAAFLV
jgi:hypothetical protein